MIRRCAKPIGALLLWLLVALGGLAQAAQADGHTEAKSPAIDGQAAPAVHDGDQADPAADAADEGAAPGAPKEVKAARADEGAHAPAAPADAAPAAHQGKGAAAPDGRPDSPNEEEHQAHGGHASIGQELSLWWVTPFALMLLCIAILPLAAEHWWHPNRNKLIVSAILGLPVIGLFLYMDYHAVLHSGEEFISFIILLGALFVISGGIVVQTDLEATPIVNTGFLALGAILASVMGTTGAAMLLIRPLLETNSQRTKTLHTVIFFIFLVANIGGCLTPLGDPPLFMGYLKGVPFQWTFGLVPEWGATVGALLVIYFVLDVYMHDREPIAALQADRLEVKPTRIMGAWLNGPLLIGVVLSVAFLNENYLPFKAFPLREGVLIALAVISMVATPKGYRRANKFTFYPILEVAALFAGIFATMIPAILILNARGGELGVTSPMHFFWATGSLSSFLDNTPTYVVFFALAQNPDIPALSAPVANTGVDALLLTAISLGAVFMGAMTYIGNAPNFMVKAIAEERGMKMPSFFGYLAWSCCILLPVFALVSYLFL